MLQRIKQIKNLGMKIMLTAFVILAVIDIFTAYLSKDVLPYVETNPAYVATGSLIPVIILNLSLVFLFAWAYKKNIPFTRFALANFLVMISVLRITAIKSNLHVYFNPPTPEQITYLAANFTAAAKVQHYQSFLMVYFSPFFLCLLVYLIWRLDHDVEKKDYRYV